MIKAFVKATHLHTSCQHRFVFVATVQVIDHGPCSKTKADLPKATQQTHAFTPEAPNMGLLLSVTGIHQQTAWDQARAEPPDAKWQLYVR